MMKLENQNILLFMDNEPVHPEILMGKYGNIRVVFLPKNTTSRLQPLDAGIRSIEKSYYVMRLHGFQTTVMHLILLKNLTFSKPLYGQQPFGKKFQR